MKWQYKTVKLELKGLHGGKLDEVDLDHELNDLGQQGWELVSVVLAQATATASTAGLGIGRPTHSSFIIFTKRQVAS